MKSPTSPSDIESHPQDRCQRQHPAGLRTWLVALCVIAASLLSGLPVRAGSILREVYQGIGGGNAVSDLINAPIYPNSPTLVTQLTDFFETPSEFDEGYGQRVRGYVLPPVSGDYTFWIASDDNGALYLSTDESPANKKEIANVQSWTSSREWGKEPNQQSAPIRLEAGRAYYVEALMKEGGGGDNLAVRWLRPDGLDEGPIPATYLLPWGVVFAAPKFTKNPIDFTAIEGQTARFEVVLDPATPATVQWQKDTVNIPNATNLVLELPNVPLSEGGTKYRVVATNSKGTATSTEGVLTVQPESTRPTLVRVVNLGTTNLQVEFSERVSVPAGSASANFKLTGGVTVTDVASASDPRFLSLAVTSLTYGTSYTLTVSNVPDRAATPNVILANSTISFLASELAPQDIGSPAVAGKVQRVAGGFDITGGGADIGGSGDQFHFAWEQRSGDFDIQVRVAGVSLVDPFLHAGLMARESFATNSRFAAIFASSAQTGCFFESRNATTAKSVTTSPTGGYPVNYPNTWLRLRRSGTVFTGFASLDGATWTSIGSISLSGATSPINVGLAVCGQNASQSATVRFREYAPTASFVEGPLVRDASREPLAPSSRATGLVISEIMYHPKPGFGGSDPLANLEYVEIYNAGAIFETLTGYRLSGGIDYRFPDGFILPAGAFVVVAAEPTALQQAYGITGVLGPYTNRLDNTSGTVRVRNEVDAVVLEAWYDSRHPWPASADGAGHSLVLAKPSWGEGQPQAWAASERVGGSPGELDAVSPSPLKSVVLNEFLAHTDPPEVDYLELYNHSNAEVDLGGCVLTDDASTNRFRIPAGTKIGARGFKAFDETVLGFRLNAAGERLFLIDPAGTRVIDSIRYDAQQNGVAFGRSPDGSSTWRRLSLPTVEAPNAAWRLEDVVINEIFYNPPSGDSDDEFVELFNRSAAPVNLAGWSFTSGIDFKFPSGTTIPAGGYLVLGRSRDRLLANYPQLNPAIALGNYNGSLGNSGDRLALAMPDQIVSTNDVGDLKTNTIHIVVSETRYGVGGRWGRWADGGGSSLELIDPHADPLRASNWADSDETQKSVWEQIQTTAYAADAVDAVNRFFVTLLGSGEALVDDIQVVPAGGAELLGALGTFENGKTGWSFFGNHSLSSVDSAGAFAGTRCLHIRSSGDGDTGPNSIRANLNNFPQGVNATIRARVRWLAGVPEILFRVKGSPMEFAGRMTLPKNLGTPGAQNSRYAPNAGPAIYEVTHTPAVPKGSEAIVVTCRVSDADGIGLLQLKSRSDGAATVTTTTMRDDGTSGDAIAGDGIYSATISGKSAGTLIGFRVEAADAAGTPGTARFPSDAPARECLVRWGDLQPAGSFAHYHMWNTTAVNNQRTSALDNTYRDCTLVLNNYRVIYNAGFRDKGSPFHGGGGDYAVTVPPDDLLLGVTDRIFGSTGNGGSESTGLRGRVSAWIARQLRIPYLHAHPVRVYRNGDLHRNISEDLEQPNNTYAQQRFPDGSDGDLYKVAIFFEFDDANGGFNAIQANLGEFKNPDGSYKLARYRFNFQTRGYNGTANNYSNLFNLARTANSTATSYVPDMLNLVDIDQWMRVFVFHRILGNWDSWGMGVGQNMFIYKAAGLSWKMFPWDIDFILGDGNGASDGLWGGPDGAVNRMFDTPAFRRMLWRAYREAANGFLTPAESSAQIDARRDSLLNNAVTEIAEPSGVKTYIAARRQTILSNLNANDATGFAITTSNGANFSTPNQTVVLEGTAKFEVVDLDVNGVPFPVEWIDFTRWRLRIPLTASSNPLTIRGRDRLGNPIAGAADAVTITYTGAVTDPATAIVFNEIQYNPADANTSFVELFNSSTTASFDLSGWRVEGLGYTFPDGSILAPNSYLVLAKDRAAFELLYGSGVKVYGEFPGSLDNGGEHLELIKPGATPAEDRRITDVRYDDRAPWPAGADGFGPSLQLVDAKADPYRAGNWAATATNAPVRATPGAANTLRQTLGAFPTVWLNEVQPNNVSGPTDNAGDRDPWIELYNSGTSAVDLANLYLTDTYTNLAKWKFPAGTSIPAKSFLIVWADNEPGEATPSALHANFRLNPTNGSIALVRFQGTPSTAAVMDYLDFDQVPANRTVGSIPDGEPRGRRSLYYPTPGAANNPAFPSIQVTINEYMAENTLTLSDPADAKYSDWFELYNAGNEPVDLTSYRLTDNLTNTTQFVVPPGYVIPAGGFLLVWADDDTKQNVPANADLHVNFKLDAQGEQLGLFSPDGALVDGISFGVQTADVSEGRIPDGAAPPLVPFQTPSPRAPNIAAGANLPPILTPIGDRTVIEQELLNFKPTATDPEGLPITWSLSADAPPGLSIDASTGQVTWTPTELQGPGLYSFVIRATDSGAPPRTAGERIRVTVLETNRPPVLAMPGNTNINEGVTFSITIGASDPDMPANHLAFALGAGAPAGAVIDRDTGAFTWTPAELQGPGTYPIEVLVTDDGVPPRSDTKSFTISVGEVDNAPAFDPVAPQSATEGVPFTYTVHAADTDNPPATVLYSLDRKPDGATIDPITGKIDWTPTEDQGPGNYLFVVRATENTPTHLSDARNFSVKVAEQNQTPALAPIDDVAVQDGDLIRFTVHATDADRPAQQLAFSLLDGAPTTAAIDAQTGAFSWRVPVDAPAGTNVISVRVTDDGPGTLADTRTFKVVVAPRFRVVVNEIQYRAKPTGGEFVELFNTSSNTTFQLGGIVLAGGNLRFTFPAGASLAPRQFVCVAANQAAFRTAYGNAPALAGTWTGTIGAPDTVGLYRSENGDLSLLNRVSFNSTAPWPVAANGTGSSLQLVDASQDNNRPGNWASTVLSAGPITLVAMTNEWSFFQEGAPPANWNLPAFDATPWPVGRGALYVEGAALPVPKTTPLTLGKLAYYFRTKFQLPAMPTGSTLKLTHAIDDGALFWLNGQELPRFNMPDGAVAYDTAATAAIGDAAIVGPTDVPATALQLGANTLAVEVHQINPGSSDIVLSLELVLDGGTLPGATPGAPNNVTAPLGEFAPLRLNEAVAVNTSGLADAAGQREPWIEVLNEGSQPVNLDGTFLTDDPANLPKWAFPAGIVIPPGGFLVVFADNQPAQGSASEPHTSFRLPAAGTPVKLVLSRLQNGAAVALDELAFTAPAANTAFIRLPDGDTATGRTTTVPTPAAANTLPDVNHAPVLTAIGARSVDEGIRLEFTASATDPDAGQSLSFAFENVPTGATVNGATFGWTPGEPQGPGTYSVKVTVTDNGTPPASASETVVITVNEVNTPPGLPAVGAQSATVGVPWSLTVTGFDNDLPAQGLVHSLQVKPTGATIAASNGAIAWTPLDAQAGSQRFVVRVTDTGSPALFAEREFFVDVTRPVAFSVNASVLEATVHLVWPSQAGVKYRVEYRDNLTGGTWTLLKEVTAAGANAEATDTVPGESRYYRVVLP